MAAALTCLIVSPPFFLWIIEAAARPHLLAELNICHRSVPQSPSAAANGFEPCDLRYFCGNGPGAAREAGLRAFRSESVKNIALSVLSTLVLIFLIEMVLRVTEVVPTRTLEYAGPSLWRINPGPLLPGLTFTDRFKRGLPFRVSINNLGFRGRDLPVLRTPGVLRVLCLGDSYTFGAYVDDAETWPAQLETALRVRQPGREVEVINSGIVGFTIVDEMDFIKEHGLQLEPDLVVLAFVLNDLTDLTRRVSARETLRRASEESASWPLGRIMARLRRSALFSALSLTKAWVRRFTGADPALQEVDIRHLLRPDYDQTTLDLFEKYRGHLAEMKTLLDGKGIPLVLMIFPYWEQVIHGATDQAQRRLLLMAQELGIPCLDLLPSYREHDPRGRKFFHLPWDHHPSARGYRRASRDLTAMIGPMVNPSGQASRLPPEPAVEPAGSVGEIP
jgi:lysophospholipase L1-like esterase